MYSTSLQLTLEGELEIIDACHDKVNKVLIRQSQLKTKRLLDEVGDEIRQQAYPILAAIEQRFRVFVSQALTEVSGFDWWNTTAPADLRSKVQPIQEKHQEDGTPLDPLECTQFDDLIKIITAETSEWSESKPLSLSDLLELFSDCASVAEVKNNLIEKTTKFAFWDVFARYFQDIKEWDKLKKSINFVINERHKVMHHRPIRLGVITALLTKKEEIFALLDAAKPELSEKERSEAKQDIQEAWDRRTILQEYIQDWQKLIEQATQPPKDWQKLMEQAAQPPKDWQKLIEQAAQPPKDWQKLIEQAA
jgi:predicted CopG family antitoxin